MERLSRQGDREEHLAQQNDGDKRDDDMEGVRYVNILLSEFRWDLLEHLLASNKLKYCESRRKSAKAIIINDSEIY